MNGFDIGSAHVTFGAWPYALVALVVPLALLALALGGLSRRRAERRFGLSAGGSAARRVLAATALLIALALVAAAAARPQWGEEEVQQERRGIDLVVALDVSLSMAVQDVSAGRLELVKDEVLALFDSLRGDRVGLVMFAGDARLRFPLTTDIAISEQMVRTTTVTTALGDGSSPATAINAARSAFVNDSSTTKVLLLISDGEQIGSATLDSLVEIQRAKDDGIYVIVAGVGTAEGGRIPVRSPITGATTFKIDSRTGNAAVSRLDEASLRAISERAEGEYIPLRAKGDLSAVAEKLFQARTSALFRRAETRPIERFQSFALGALILTVAPLLLGPLFRPVRNRRFVTSIATVAALGLFLAACGEDAGLSLNRAGNKLYASGNFAGALTKYREAQVKRPDLPALNYNAANTLYRANEVDRAIEEAQRALNTDDPIILARVYYSLGNYYAGLNRWLEARAAYRNALIHDPASEDGKYNLEVANRMLGGETPPPVPPPAASPTPQASPTATGTAEPGGQPGGGDATPTGTPGGSGSPTAGGTPPATPTERPGNLNPSETQSLLDALRRLDSGEAYEVEDALRILEMLRKAQEGRASEIPTDSVQGPPDW